MKLVDKGICGFPWCVNIRWIMFSGNNAGARILFLYLPFKKITKMNNRSKLCLVALYLLLAIPTMAYSQQINPIEGRWDMVISQDGKELPSWLEIRHSGTRTLVGRFVYAMGSARPISEIKLDGGKFTFSIPPQWEEGD